MMIQILDNAGQIIATESFGPTNGGGGFFGGGKVSLNGVRCQMSCNLTPVVDKATNDSLIAKFGGKDSAEYKAAVLAIRLPLMAQILGATQPAKTAENKAVESAPIVKPYVMSANAAKVFDESGLPENERENWREFCKAYDAKNANQTVKGYKLALTAWVKQGAKQLPAPMHKAK